MGANSVYAIAAKVGWFFDWPRQVVELSVTVIPDDRGSVA
jgi:hypothetical protein